MRNFHRLSTGALDSAGAYGIINPAMKTKRKRPPISDLLRHTVSKSGVPLRTLERETGVTRASIRRFINGEQFLRLDMADALASYFGLSLTKGK